MCALFSRAVWGPSVNKEMVESRSDLNHWVGLGASDIHNHPQLITKPLIVTNSSQLVGISG